MLDFDTLYKDLDTIGLGSWRDTLDSLLRERVAPGAHGHLEDWIQAINRLPRTDTHCVVPHPSAVAITGQHLEGVDDAQIRECLRQLIPWRKGPFKIQDINLDTEWRSNLKWERICDRIASLNERIVLDVGCGNGYYAFRMLQAGARHVIGVDPTLLFVSQFAAIKKLSGITAANVLPLRLHELPENSAVFDTTFSMGVLYHQRNPHEHLNELRRTLRSGGDLVLETLILPGDDLTVLQPEDRYARMRNVWHLPTIPTLLEWLRNAGFPEPQIIDISTTTVEEQRTTEWMPFESLAEALDPQNPSLTVEGLPAPQRAVLIGRAG